MLVQFLLSIFIATICAPFLFWLNRREVPTVIAVVIITTVISGLAVLLVLVQFGIVQFALACAGYFAINTAISSFIEPNLSRK